MPTPLALVWDLIGKDSASVTFDRVGASAIANAKRIDSMTVATERAGAAAGGQTSKFGAMYKGLAALATIDVGVHLVKMAADFEYQMNRMVTAAGESQKNLKTVSDGVLKLMGETGTGAQDLEKGLYQIESAGYHGAAGLNILKVAAQGAKIENANLGDVANAVTSAMVDYHIAAGDAASVMNTLIAATAHGKTTTEEMALAVSKVGAAGATAHVPLADLTAAIATMTMHGTDAAVAGTYLRQVIGQLEGGSAKARLVMAGLGLDANQVALTLSSGPGGLATAIGMLDDAIQKHLTPSGLVAIETFKKSSGSLSDFQKVLGNIPPSLVSTFSALSNMTGGVKSLQGFLQLGGENLQTFKDTTDAVNEAVTKGGKSVEGWAATQKQLSVQLDMLRHGAEALGIRFGEALIPAVQHAIDGFKEVWTVIHPLVTEVGTVLVGAWHVLVDVLHVVGSALGAVGRFAKANQDTLTELGKIVLATWLAFKGVSIAVLALKTLDGALLTAKVRMVTFAESFAAVSAGMRTMSFGAFATGLGAVALAGYAVGKSIDSWLNGDKASVKLGSWTANVNSFRDALQQSNGEMTKAIALGVAKKLQDSGLAERAAAAGISLDQLTSAVGGNDDAMRALIARWQSSGKPNADTLFALTMLHTQYGIGATQAAALNTVTGKLTVTTAGSANAAEHAAVSTAKVTAATTAAAITTQDFDAKLAAVGRTANGVGTDLISALSSFEKSAGSAADRAGLIGATLKAANGDALSFASSMVGAASANRALTEGFRSDVDKIAGIRKQIHDLTTQSGGKVDTAQLAELQKQLSEAYANTEKAAINLRTGAIDFSKGGAPALVQGLQSIQDAAVKAAGALYQHEVATKGGKDAATDAYNLYVSQTKGALIDEAGQLGITSGQAKKLADRYFGMPKQVKTLIQQEGANPVLDVLTRIGKLLAKFTGQPWDVKVKVTVQDQQLADLQRNLKDITNPTAQGAQNKRISIVGANADGTNDWRGGLTWVGERGPELVDLPQHSKVYSHPQSAALANSQASGPVTVNITNQNTVPVSEPTATVVALREAQTRLGRR